MPICNGATATREISQALHLSIGTVKNYITQILSKLELQDRIAAVLFDKEYWRSP